MFPIGAQDLLNIVVSPLADENQELYMNELTRIAKTIGYDFEVRIEAAQMLDRLRLWRKKQKLP